MTNDGRFNGYVQSVDFNGDALITLEEDAVVMEKAGKSLVVPYAEIDGFSVQDYRLAINAETYSVLVSQLGRDVGVLYERLWDAYNARTLRAFFVRGAPNSKRRGNTDMPTTAAGRRARLKSSCLTTVFASCRPPVTRAAFRSAL